MPRLKSTDKLLSCYEFQLKAQINDPLQFLKILYLNLELSYDNTKLLYNNIQL